MWIGIVVDIRQVVEEVPADPAHARRNLGEPDDGLYRFDLAEEGAYAAEAVMPPVLQQPGCLSRNLPMTRIRYAPPTVDLSSNAADYRRGIILLNSSGKPFSFVQHQYSLFH